MRKLSLAWLVVFGIAFLIGGCAPASFRAHSDIDRRLKGVKTIGIIPADVRVYELTAGGVEELRDDWSDQGKKNVMQAAAHWFAGGPVKATGLTIRKEWEGEMEDVQALYWAVSASILQYAYGEQGLPTKKDHFEYSLGPLQKFLSAHGVDAVLLVNGFDEISTGGRKALQALSAITSVITGVRYRSGFTGMSIALVDRSGMVLWYNVKLSEGGYDLRDAGSAQGMVELVLRDFPEAKK